MAHLSAQGAIGAPHATSEVATTPFPVQLGTRMRDSAGNEYLYVDFTGTVYTGTPVQINANFTAAKVGATGRGAFGVACGYATSDNAGWVQIFGRALIQLLGDTAGVSPSDSSTGPTTLSTTAQTLFWLPTTATSTGPEGIRWTSGWGTSPSQTAGYRIVGLSVAADASVGDIESVTKDTSHTGQQIAVFLNYARIEWHAAHA